MNLKIILGWAAVAFVVWFVIARSTDAAHLVYNVGHFLTSAAHGLSNFFATT